MSTPWFRDDFTAPGLHPRWGVLLGSYAPPGLSDIAIGLARPVEREFAVTFTASIGQGLLEVGAVDFGTGWSAGLNIYESEISLLVGGEASGIDQSWPETFTLSLVRGILDGIPSFWVEHGGQIIYELAMPDTVPAGANLQLLVATQDGATLWSLDYVHQVGDTPPSPPLPPGLYRGGKRIKGIEIGGRKVLGVAKGGRPIWEAEVAPAAVATLELGPETVQGYSFPNVTVYTVPEGEGGVYLVEAVATKTPEMSGASVQIQAEMWQSYPGSPDGGFYSRAFLGYLDSGVPFSVGREFVPGDEILLSASSGSAGSFVLHANVQVFFVGQTQDLPRYTIDHTGGVADPVESEWVTVHSTVVAQNSMTSGTWTVTWDRPNGVSYYGVRVLLDGGSMAAVSPYMIGTARPTHQSVPVSETVVLEGQTIQFQVYAGGSTVATRKINSTRALLS